MTSQLKLQYLFVHDYCHCQKVTERGTGGSNETVEPFGNET